MEKFFSLPEEKQKVIIDAGFACFSSNGYKKTSTSDIAAAAGISKAMVFHYFGSKKALYFYLVNLCGNIIISEVKEKFDSSITDFFDRIKLSSDIELSVIKKHPAIMAFLTSVYFEDDDEVKADIKALFNNGEGEAFRNKIAFDGMDATKFKDGIDLKLLMKMLTWMGEGFANILQGKTEADLEVYVKEFYECLDMLRNNFYKTEYL